jgi:hypothetical protein
MPIKRKTPLGDEPSGVEDPTFSCYSRQFAFASPVVA